MSYTTITVENDLVKLTCSLEAFALHVRDCRAIGGEPAALAKGWLEKLPSNIVDRIEQHIQSVEASAVEASNA